MSFVGRVNDCFPGIDEVLHVCVCVCMSIVVSQVGADHGRQERGKIPGAEGRFRGRGGGREADGENGETVAVRAGRRRGQY